MKVIFVDDQEEDGAKFPWVLGMKEEADHHEMEIISKFDFVDEVVQEIMSKSPDVVFMDYDFASFMYDFPAGVTGSTLVSALREAGYSGAIIGNSGSGIKNFKRDGVANLLNGSISQKSPRELKVIMDKLIERRKE